MLLPFGLSFPNRHERPLHGHGDVEDSDAHKNRERNETARHGEPGVRTSVPLCAEAERHLDMPPNLRLDVLKGETDARDTLAHGASLAEAGLRFHGSSSA